MQLAITILVHIPIRNSTLSLHGNAGIHMGMWARHIFAICCIRCTVREMRGPIFLRLNSPYSRLVDGIGSDHSHGEELDMLLPDLTSPLCCRSPRYG